MKKWKVTDPVIEPDFVLASDIEAETKEEAMAKFFDTAGYECKEQEGD